MKPLYQLPNGAWIAPELIQGVQMHEIRGVCHVNVDLGPRMEDRRHVAEMSDPIKAAEMRDEIARVANEARADVPEPERAS